MTKLSCVALVACILMGMLRAEDKAVAAAFASGAAKLAAEGKTDKAKELCYKALANDENSPEALYEMAKIFEKENNTTAAADFFVRASREFGKAEAANPAFASKRKDADVRILKLNPYATRYASALADYTVELNAITKRVPDSLTLEEACDRADTLKLRAMLPPDKAPKFERAAAAAPPKKNTEGEGKKGLRNMREMQPVTTSVAPDVERVLKAAGWEKITGTWKKISENVYEVTDGKLETAKINGAVQVIVHKGAGTVKVMVRNNQEDYSGYSSSSGSTYYSNYGSGFGYIIDGESAKIYTPYGGFSNNKFYAYMEREDALPAGAPKNVVLITVDEGKLEYFLNNASKKKANYNISKSGPFVIQINGTRTIESPMAKGQ